MWKIEINIPVFPMQNQFNNVLKNAEDILNMAKITKKIVYRGGSNFKYKDTSVVRVEDYLTE